MNLARAQSLSPLRSVNDGGARPAEGGTPLGEQVNGALAEIAGCRLLIAGPRRSPVRTASATARHGL
jgi:hypothetical protein